MQANLTGVKHLNIGVGAGPYGPSFHVAQYSGKVGGTNGSFAWIATNIHSGAIIQSFLSFSGWQPASDGRLIFPASCFNSVTASSPSGNVTVPMLPLILLSRLPFDNLTSGHQGCTPALFKP
jgi:hypothetical protein